MKKNWYRVMAGALAMTLTIGSSLTVFATEAAPGDTEVETEEGSLPETTEEETTEPSVKLTDVLEIPEGVTIGDIDVSGLTGEEADRLVSDYLKEQGQISVELEIDDEKVEVPLEELGLIWKNESQVSQTLYNVSRGNLLSQYKAIKDIENDTVDTSVQFGLDSEAAIAALDEILVPLNVEPQNATISRNADGTWNISEEVDGIAADSAETMELLNAKLEDWDGKPFSVEVPAEISRADISSDAYKEIGNTPIASCTTNYITDTPARNHNVELAASRINGRVFFPGEEISYNAMISPVTAESGYGYAGAYANGQVIQSIGGGICQLATTFYVCCLQLELHENARKAHSMSVTYVPLAMDATVSPGDNLDLKVVNTTGHVLYVECYTSGGNLTVNFYGKDDRDYTIQYRSVTLYDEGFDVQNVEDMSLKPGTVIHDADGHSKCAAQLWKDYYTPGSTVPYESVLVHTDSYRSSPTVRRYGPAIDSQGKHYLINDQGYAVGEDGRLWRLNEDGSFYDDPVSGKTAEEIAAEEAAAATAGSTEGSEETPSTEEQPEAPADGEAE